MPAGRLRRGRDADPAHIAGGLGAQLNSLSRQIVNLAGFQQTTPTEPFAAPWLDIIVTVIAVPLATVLGAVLLTRSRTVCSRPIT